ncbi:tail length tape measure protein [Mycobacterium phage Rem711]|uniref:Tape measure protein n=1 Tax=Mycobacterium phage Rem711 TaxID=2079285 RepID=A0A2K9VEW6_9CAUD|nr:tail length tape measure protein [Mycobacterium phage Rem711]AUV60801.1 tape measure protein [Mycobacterium phage Rem711]
MADRTGAGQDVGYYALPIIPSIEGIGPAIDKKLGKVFGDIGKQSAKAIAGGVQDGVAAAEAAVKKSSDNIAKLRDKEAAAVDKLAAAEARIEEVRDRGGSALKRAEAQRNAALRQQQAALREIEAQTRSLQQAQQSLSEAQEEAARGGRRSGEGFLAGLRGSLSGAASSGSDAASSFAEGFAGSSALLRLGSAGGPVGLALAAAGTVAGGLLVKNVIAGIEREPARDLIQARLRLDDASMADLGRAAAKAYVNNFGESVQDNLRAGQLAIQGGLVANASDPELAGVVQKIQAVSQLIDADINETTKSASILLRSGLAGSAEEAFDVIAAGYQLTGDLGGDWLDSIGEYSSGWKNAGLTAQQALALIKQGQDLGVDVTDRSADALREFGRRVSEEGDTIVTVLDNIGLDGEAMFEKFKQGGPAGFEAFDAVFDRIRTIEDPVRRNQVAMALLGDTAGDFIGSFTQWDPSEAVNKFGNVEGAAQDAADTMGDNTAGSFEEAKRSIEQSLDDVQDKLADVFGDDLKTAADWVSEHTDDIAKFFATIGEASVAGIADIVKFVADSSRALAQFVNAVGDVEGAFLKAGGKILDLLGQDDAAKEWNDTAESMFSLGDGLYRFADAADARVRDLDNLADSIGDVDSNANDAKDSTGDLADNINDLPDRKDVKLNVTDGAGNPIDIISGSPLFPTLAPGSNPFDTSQGAPSAGGPPPGFPAPNRPGDGPGLNLPGITGPGGLGGLGPGGRPTPGQGLFVGSAGALPAAVEQWRPAVRQALAQFGPAYGITNYSAWENALLQQIKTESSGNPGAYNPNDSNGRGGTQQVRGLLQFLDSTYLANNISGRPIGDPLGQIAAAIPYVAKKYGMNPDGSPRQIGQGQGFEYGGPVFGGTRGKDSVPALLAGDEHVVTTGEVDAAGGHGTWYKLRAMARAGLLRGFENGGAVAPELEQVKQIAARFGLTPTSDFRAGDSGYHGRGLALDLSNGTGNTPQMLAFAQYMATNFGASLAELIYDAPGWAGNVKDGRNVGAFGDFYTLGQAGRHDNHVHVAVRGAGQGQSLGSQSLNGVLPAVGPSSVQQVNAFGNGFEPGVGTPGYNELGEPGYYQTDPRSIAQAERRSRDAQRNIADADQAIADAEARRAELDKDIKASAEDKAKADRDIDRAREAAARAREDAEWAEQDAEEARRGRFTAAREARKESQKNGNGDLSGIGGIFGSFLKETLGFDGSLFPDLAGLLPVQLAGGLLSAFKGPILGAAQGQLGIQQPGWTPGAPVQVPTSSSASGLPFGMVPSPFDFAGTAGPDSAPFGSPASGFGAGPAPGPVDQSRNVSIAVNAGPREDEIANTVRREVASVDRLQSHMPMGWGG